MRQADRAAESLFFFAAEAPGAACQGCVAGVITRSYGMLRDGRLPSYKLMVTFRSMSKIDHELAGILS